jgi:hypothetical protein
MLTKPVLYSLASGCLWIVPAILVAYIVSPVRTTPLEVAATFAGGIVVAPLIGVLIGYIARSFSHRSRAQRIWMALGDLYLATYLFLLATGFGQVMTDWIMRGRPGGMQRSLLVDPLLGTVLGLTYTGIVLVLLPLSYVSHVLIGKAWDQGTFVKETAS